MAIVEYEKRGRIAVITMNRPERLNALGHELLSGLAESWKRFQEEEDAWLAILTGVGRSFCAGMDVKERAQRESAAQAPPLPPINDPYRLGKVDKPTIAAINGFAFGEGFYLAARADLRIAVESATFQVSEVTRSLLAPRGGQTGCDLNLRENLPFAVDMELASGRALTARRLYDVGFINQIVPEDKLMTSAIEFAENIISSPPLAVHYNMLLTRELRNRRASPPLYELREEEEHYKKLLSASDDAKEARQSFIEKRKPIYKRH